MEYWLTSKNRKVHQRAMNKLVRVMNKNIEKDDLWNGRFVVKQEAAQWYLYEDGSGAELFVVLRFIDRCTGRHYEVAEIVNHWRGPRAHGGRLWEKMNWFIVEHCEVWDEEFARKRNLDEWREYNKNVRVV